MEKALNEIGKLRNEMRVGFIEIENQLKANTDKTVESFSKFSSIVEKGFIAVEEAIEQDVSNIQQEIKDIKSRSDRANI